jgi:hypothetical protein
VIFDFDRTFDPFVRLMRDMLPNGLNQDGRTLALLAVWAATLLVVAAWSWRRTPPR